MVCGACGKEFDDFGYQIVVPELGASFDRLDCAALALRNARREAKREAARRAISPELVLVDAGLRPLA